MFFQIGVMPKECIVVPLQQVEKRVFRGYAVLTSCTFNFLIKAIDLKYNNVI